jgi:hypothetical protein
LRLATDRGADLLAQRRVEVPHAVDRVVEEPADQRPVLAASSIVMTAVRD